MTDYLKSIVSAFHDLLFVFTEDGVIEDCISANHKDELLLPREEFLGKNHSEVLPPFLSKKINQAFHEIDQGKERYKFDYCIDINGKKQWYSAILSKIDHGDTPHYLGSVRNITERKNQELLVRGILDSSPGGVMVLGAIRDSEDTIVDFSITHINKSVEILTGTTSKYLIGKRLTSLISGNGRKILIDKFTSAIEKEAPVEFQYQHKDERIGVIWYHSKVVKYGDGVVSTFMDITEQKKTEEKLAAKNKELEELNRHKDKLFSVISHDLRNSCSAAQGIFSILFEDYENLSKEEIFEFLKLVKQRTDSTQELLEDLLAWSNNQFHEVTVNLEKLNLVDIVRFVFNSVRPNAENKGITLVSQVPDTMYVHADQNMTKTILRNLVINGIKFSDSGDEITVQAKETGDYVNISVIDEGVGIAEDALEKVLNKKSSYTTPGTKGEKGSGLGLDLCIDFVEMHDGSIWAESEPGKGSTFTFTLPRFREGK